MVYSTTTAIHSVVLATIRTRLVLGIDPKADNYELVRVQSLSGPAQALSYDEAAAAGDNALWMPVVPMAWDADADPVLAIVGFTFLVFLPMQIWSLTLRESMREPGVKLLLSLWGVFLFAGSLCTLVAEAYVQIWAFPQMRFWPRGFHDALPLMNDGSQTVGGTWDGQDRYHWNRTPCFDNAWPLRDVTEIKVLPGHFGSLAEGNTFWSALVAMYFLFGATSVANLSIAVIMSKPGRRLFGMMRLHYFSKFWSDANAHRLGLSQSGQWGTIAGFVLTFGAAGLGLVMKNIGRRRQNPIRALSNRRD
ncbi:hypothetical protein ARSEF4850_005402 [Beauveria asiatica]